MEIYRRFARLRERLVPYLREQAHRSVETSRPLMRALFFDWPHDPAIWDFPHEYLLGDDLLVAPVVEPGATSLDVHLPAGRWIDAWTGDELTGPRLVRREVPLGSIPVFIREAAAGSLLPLFADE
jgi:alpha-glucosidase (family GH31 glycosyl hydrolase)